MNIGTESRKKTISAAVLGVLAILAFVYEIVPMLSGPSATTSANSERPVTAAPRATSPQRRGTAASNKKPVAPKAESLDPTLQLQLLAASEQIKYEGSGRNIFVSQAEAVEIPKPKAPGHTDIQEQARIYTPPPVQQAPPIPLKFFGFANQPGEPRRIFLSQGEDVFVAGEGEIVDRRYKVLRITPTFVEIQDVVNSGPPQNIPLTPG